MAGDVRGADLNSWWQNRAAFRSAASQEAEQWRAAAAQFGKAAGGVKATPQSEQPNETLDSAMHQGEAVLASLQNAQRRLAALEDQRQAAQSNFTSIQRSVQSRSEQRVHAERAAAQQREYASKVQQAKSKATLRKIGAVLIFLFVMALIIRY